MSGGDEVCGRVSRHLLPQGMKQLTMKVNFLDLEPREEWSGEHSILKDLRRALLMTTEV